MTAPRRRRGLSMVGLAGWLFADLLLVLALVGLASMPAPPHRAAALPHPTATPTPTHSLGQLESKPKDLQNLTVDVSGLLALGAAGTVNGPAADALVGEVNQLLASVPPYADGSPRRVGFVIVWVYEPESQLGVAIAAAKEMAQVLVLRAPAFVGAAHKDLWSGNGSQAAGTAELEIYFYGG